MIVQDAVEGAVDTIIDVVHGVPLGVYECGQSVGGGDVEPAGLCDDLYAEWDREVVV